MKTLNIFDFDGTLFKSPTDTKENREIYFQSENIPWEINKKTAVDLSKKLGRKINPRSGWFGRAETLLPPLVPDPIPDDMWVHETVEKFYESKNSKDNLTILMTGRHSGIKSQVLRICYQKNLFKIEKNKQTYYSVDENVTCLFRGDDGPFVKNFPKINHNDTISWKLWIIEKYLNLFETIENVNIWEDREEHVKSFTELKDLFPQKFYIFHVT